MRSPLRKSLPSHSMTTANTPRRNETMKLQPASKKEIKRIAIGTGICDLILLAVLFVLSLEGLRGGRTDGPGAEQLLSRTNAGAGGPLSGDQLCNPPGRGIGSSPEAVGTIKRPAKAGLYFLAVAQELRRISSGRRKMELMGMPFIREARAVKAHLPRSVRS